MVRMKRFKGRDGQTYRNKCRRWTRKARRRTRRRAVELLKWLSRAWGTPQGSGGKGRKGNGRKHTVKEEEGSRRNRSEARRSQHLEERSGTAGLPHRAKSEEEEEDLLDAVAASLFV